MKKKGFTLIELLAVIVVLAIVAVIAIPIITNVIEKARSAALKDSAYGLIESANLYYATSITKGENFDETTFNLVDGKLVSGSKELNYKGQKFKGSSYVAINEVGSVKLMITDGKYYVSKEYDEVNVTMSEDQDDALTREELTSKVDELEALINSESNIFIKSHPIGSIYTTVSADENSVSAMATKYPGTTWEVYAQGRVLVGLDSTNTNFNLIEKTGGVLKHNHGGKVGATTLSVSQIPNHSHNFIYSTDSFATENIVYQLGRAGGPHTGVSSYMGVTSNIETYASYSVRIAHTGGSGSHIHTISEADNTQPYITVYMYKRIS